MKKYILPLVTFAALLVNQSCKTDFDTDVADIKVTNGDANFTRYVALGNSLTSGYRDGALYIDGQNESYPSMLGQQMKLAGGGEFTQPLMSDNNGGLFITLPGVPGNIQIQDTKLQISGFVDGKPIIGNVNNNVSTNQLTNIYNASKPFNNLGVPGAKSYHLVAGGYGSTTGLLAGTANPYFARFASSQSASVLDDAMAQNPTFFSLWIGANDVLSYALNGGTNSTGTGAATVYTAAVDQGAANNNNPTTYKANDISSSAVVGTAIKLILDGFKSKGAKGVIANVPSITSIPYFTTVPYNAIPLDAAKAQALNTSLYNPLKAILTVYGQGDRLNPVVEGNNPILIVDNSLTDLTAQITTALTMQGIPATQAQFIGKAFGRTRQAKQGELVLLPASKLLGIDALTNQPATPTSQFVIGASYPIGDQLSLTTSEVTKISNAVTAYNTSIKGLADNYSLALFDANSKMIDLNSQSGITWDGVKYSAKFVTGGAFSLDGVHLTGRGYAIVANEFIKSINAKYNSTLPQVDPNKYSGVKFP